uniref:Apple domain-containing protein n=1 Tax=Onchocerca volvulus TaxID=6282 RepID=A0A8R1U0N4_ONCVO
MLWWHSTAIGRRQQRFHQNFILFLITNIPIFTWATTEWFGDSRANMNPAQSAPFYDVIYDLSECPEGLESEAIPEYAYFGPMVASMDALRHAECLENCVKHSKCVAEDGFCELLSESQLDNPRLMRPFKQAIYFENIQCRTENDIIDEDSVCFIVRNEEPMLKRIAMSKSHQNFNHVMWET